MPRSSSYGVLQGVPCSCRLCSSVSRAIAESKFQVDIGDIISAVENLRVN